MTSQPRILLRRQPQVDTSPSLFDMHMATAGSNLDLATRGVPISGASGRFYRDFPSWLEVWAGRELSGNSGNHCAIASPSSHARATFTNIGVLAAVIVTRTFLSWSLPSISADEAMQRLIEGNNRFLQGSARFPIVCKETLADLARGQQPYATILGCSDSRVPPELIFDADFGELFIIRVA
jgi:hypothetical protein